LRDDAALDGVGRHGRARRQRARGRRPGANRRGGDRGADAGRAAAALRRRPRLGADRRGARYAAAVTKVGLAGLGYWGPNLARNFDELAQLAWLCDLSEEQRARFATRYPDARLTADFDEMLADESLEAVIVATPVVTHADLAKRALEAGKHVLVEKPPALTGAEVEELVATAEEHGRVLMPGHLLLYHPGVARLKELIRSGELGDVLYVYGNRQNLGKIRKDENALWSLGVHDLSVIQYLIQEEIVEAAAHGHAFLNEGVEDVVFCYLRFASGKIAHMHLSWLDPHKMRPLTVVGRQRAVSPRSRASRQELPPAERGDGTIVSTGAVVFAGAMVGARVILGAHSCVRERVLVGDDVVIGRGSLVGNDTSVGAMTK